MLISPKALDFKMELNFLTATLKARKRYLNITE